MNLFKIFGLRKQIPSENPKGSFGIPREQANPAEQHRQDVEDAFDFETAPKYDTVLNEWNYPKVLDYMKQNNLTVQQLLDLSSLSADEKEIHGGNIQSILRSAALQNRNLITGRRKFGTGRGGPMKGSKLEGELTAKNIPENYPETLDWPGLNYPTQEDLEALQKPTTFEEYEKKIKPTWSPEKESKEPYNVEEMRERYFTPSEWSYGETPLALILKPSLLANAFEDWLWSTDAVPELKSEGDMPSVDSLWEIYLSDADLEHLPDATIEEAREHLHTSGGDENWELPDDSLYDATLSPEERDFEMDAWWNNAILPQYIMGRNPPKYIRDLINTFMDVSPAFKANVEAEAGGRWWEEYNPRPEEKEEKSLTLSLYKAFGLRKRRLSDREKEAARKKNVETIRFQGGHPEVENEEEGTRDLPFGMNPRQYRIMAQHFKIVWPFNPDSAKGEKDAWYMFQNENGPWYARGLYGRVHSTKEAGIGLQYSAPRQWHSRSEFESGIPGQTHSAEHFGEIGGGKGRGHEFRRHNSGVEYDSFNDPTIRFDRFHPEFKISPNYVRFRTNPQDVTADTWKGHLPFLPDDTVIRNLDNLFPHINPPRSKAGVYPTSQETWTWDI